MIVSSNRVTPRHAQALLAAQRGYSEAQRQFAQQHPHLVWIAIRRNVSSATRQRIFARDGFTCSYCGKVGGRLECDHIVPVSRGGADDDSNLTTACRECNLSKSAKMPEEWLGP